MVTNDSKKKKTEKKQETVVTNYWCEREETKVPIIGAPTKTESEKETLSVLSTPIVEYICVEPCLYISFNLTTGVREGPGTKGNNGSQM